MRDVWARTLLGMLLLLAPSAGAAERATPGPVMDKMGRVAGVQVAGVLLPLPGGLRVRGPGGAPLPLARARGRVVLLYFWDAGCAPCRHDLPDLAGLAAALGPGVRIMPVAVGMSRAEAARILKEITTGPLAPFTDPKGRLAAQLQVTRVPTAYIIDPAGRLVGRRLGRTDWDSPRMERFLAVARTPEQ